MRAIPGRYSGCFNNGITLIEILFAMALASFAFAGLYSFFDSAVDGYSLIVTNSEQSAMSRYVAEKIEAFFDELPSEIMAKAFGSADALNVDEEAPESWKDNFRENTGIWEEGEFFPDTEFSVIALLAEQGFAIVTRLSDGTFNGLALYIEDNVLHMDVKEGDEVQSAEIAEDIGDGEIEINAFYYDRNRQRIVIPDSGEPLEEFVDGLQMLRVQLNLGDISSESVAVFR